MGKLLNKAKARKMKMRKGVNNPRMGDIQLALAWTRDEVGIVQVSHAYNLKCHSDAYRKLARSLKAHLQQQV